MLRLSKNSLAVLSLFLLVNFDILAQQLSDELNHFGDDQNFAIYNRLEIFPEGKIGNAVYEDKLWLYSDANLTIIDAIALSALDATVLWVQSAAGEGRFHFIPNLAESSFNKLSKSRLTVPYLSGRMVIYINAQEKFEVFAFPYNSISDEFVFDESSGRVAFYHLAKIEEDEFGEFIRYQLRIHVYYEQEDVLASLPYVVYNNSLNLFLSWQQERLVVNFGDGRIESYDVRLTP